MVPNEVWIMSCNKCSWLPLPKDEVVRRKAPLKVIRTGITIVYIEKWIVEILLTKIKNLMTDTAQLKES